MTSYSINKHTLLKLYQKFRFTNRNFTKNMSQLSWNFAEILKFLRFIKFLLSVCANLDLLTFKLLAFRIRCIIATSDGFAVCI